MRLADAMLMGFVLTLVAACAVLRPAPIPDAPPGGDPDDCDLMCENLARLGCPGNQGSRGDDGVFGTEDDVSCAQVCRDTVESGFTLNQECQSAASSCESADRCLELDE